MTNLQLQARFEQRLQNHIKKKLDIRTIDIEFYLNEGYRRFTEYWYSLYEDNETARKRLSPLVVSTTLTRAGAYSGAGNHPNGELWDLPETCKYVVLEQVDISLIDCHGDPTTKTRVNVKPVKTDYYNLHIGNPYKKPYNELVWRLDVGSKIHELIHGTDTTRIENYHITYLTIPNTITLLTGTPETTSIEIEEEFHEEIIDKALEVAIETFKLINSFQTNN